MTYEGEFNGINYNSYLISSEGVEIVLYVESFHTREDIKKAKQQAVMERDVVKFSIKKMMSID